ALTMSTLAMAGGASPAWMRQAAQAVADAAPSAAYRTLANQTHEVAPEVLAPVLVEFFTGR
ncbi:MAG: alpha/beta hydrolase, partial [Ktedonobacterales bacterium]